MSSSLERNHICRSTKKSSKQTKWLSEQKRSPCAGISSLFKHFIPTSEFSSRQLRAQGSLLFRIQGDPSRSRSTARKEDTKARCYVYEAEISCTPDGGKPKLFHPRSGGPTKSDLNCGWIHEESRLQTELHRAETNSASSSHSAKGLRL
jgi:hypothetical protein